MEWLLLLFDTAGYPARWHCGSWTPFWGWLHILSDISIFVAYMGIPVVLLYFLKKLHNVKFNYVFVLFAAFIFLCGLTHLDDAIIFWYPFYNFAGVIKFLTGLVSMATLVMLAVLTPKAVRLLNERFSSKSLTDIVESVSQGILVVNYSGKIVFSNKIAANMFRLDQGDMVGRTVEEFMPLKNREKHIEYRKEYLQHPVKREMGKLQNIYALTSEGNKFPVEIGLTPITFEFEPCVLCSILNITERRYKEKQMEELNNTLRDSIHDLNEFAHVGSHDLREPLRGLHNYSVMLMEDYKDVLDDKGRAKLEKIGELSQQLDKRIDSLLAYTKIKDDCDILTPVNLMEWVEHFKNEYSDLINEKQIQIVLAKALPTVMAYRTKLEEVFTGLILNGIIYNHQAYPTIEIGVLPDHFDAPENVPTIDCYGFYVKDNGIGIKKAHLKSVFTLFKRLHPKSEYGERMGIGLTFIKKIIQLHGGGIWIESEEDVGTTVYFTIKKNISDQ